jgi:hypothetical protein
LASLDFDSLDIPSGHFLNDIPNFSGEECKSLESDAAGSLWVGCANGLYYVTTGVGGGVTTVRRYGLDDGLLSLKIHDISVDPATGKVWIATDHGVSMIEGAGPPAIPNGSLGNVVRIFHPRDLVGNQVQWDGKNQQGKPVTAGVYLFSIVSGSDVQRGKVIVAR